MRTAAASGVALCLAAAVAAAPDARPVNIPYADAAPLLDAVRGELLPPELVALTAGDRAEAWPAWVARRDAEIRGRLLTGDEDSLLNLVLLGETFTARPRLTELADLRRAGPPLQRFHARVDDLIAALSGGRADERLEFVRSVLRARGIEEPLDAGRVRPYLTGILERVIRETEAYAHAVADMTQATDALAKLKIDAGLYRDRGLSSDTSIVPAFAIDRALAAMKGSAAFGAGPIRRVAIVGPGLDIIDRRDGRDFSPVQTIQPFALVDSLLRLGLAAGGALEVTTLDVSARVNGHIDAARERARRGSPYVLQLPLDRRQFTQELVRYWESFGGSIAGERATPMPPATRGAIAVKDARVRPEVVLSIAPRDVNVVLQRLELADDERFDLVIATNVLIYYDVFERSLAAANLARMLRPGGILLTNNLIVELPPLPLSLAGFTDLVYTRPPSALGDRVLWYLRLAS